MLVGGDFYDYIQGENSDNFLIVVGDAAGHGLPAAMYAQSTCRLLKEIITKQNIDKPNEILSRLNNIFVLSSSASMQVTISMYLAYLDATKRKLRLSRAGDCRAYCITNECVEEIYKKEIRGNSLGEWPPSESLYKIGEYDLAAEDLILICSDGLIDIVSGNQAEVFNFLRRINISSAKAAIESIKRSVFLTGHGQEEDNFLTPFIKGNEKADDITVVCIKVLDKQKENVV